MADFNERYTNANRGKDAAAYDAKLFAALNLRLQQAMPSYTPGLSYGLLIAMLCAQRRGDVAGPLFQDAILAGGEGVVKDLFSVIREAITLTCPFVGLPNTMPANFGLIAQLQQRNIVDVPYRSRLKFQDEDYVQLGRDTYTVIYCGVGNPEVALMVAQYLPDLSTYATTSIFGYCIGGCNSMPLAERELLVVSSIIALGASRQARSHCKASIQLGNSPELLVTVDEVAQELAKWNGQPLPEKLDVPQLVKELDAELARLGQ